MQCIARVAASMHFRRQKGHEETINLTPLIDVVFLLLIFFMVSTTFTKETHLDIDLPEASVDPVETPVVDSIEIVVQSSGVYLINGRPVVNSKAETLKQAIQSVTQGKTNLPVTLAADADASHQSVVTAMDVAGQLGFTQLRITTRQPSEQ